MRILILTLLKFWSQSSLTPTRTALVTVMMLAVMVRSSPPAKQQTNCTRCKHVQPVLEGSPHDALQQAAYKRTEGSGRQLKRVVHFCLMAVKAEDQETRLRLGSPQPAARLDRVPAAGETSPSHML